MSAEDAPEDAVAPRHRPLPSVGMPLLRDERRAFRARRAITSGVVAAVAVALLGLAIWLREDVARAWASVGDWWSRPSETAESKVVPFGAPPGAEDEGPSPYTPTDLAGLAPGAAPPGSKAALVAADEADAAEEDGTPPAPVVNDDGSVSTRRSFGDARFFREALERAGLSPEECAAVEGALDGVMDFRRCRPADELVVVRSPAGTLVRFEYHPGPTHYYRARRQGAASDTFEAEKVDVPVETRRIAAGGRIRTSLGEALVDAGLGRALVGVFVEAFAGKANFTRDAREGDVFRIVVEERVAAGESLGYGAAHAVEYAGRRTGQLRAYWYEGRNGEGDYYDDEGRSVHGSWLRSPLRYERISSRFDPRRMHPILKRVVPHNGVDYAAGTGTPVWAGAGGRVTFAGYKGANGNMVAVRHEGGYETYYCHLSRIERGIRPGERVDRRETIGYVGSTGRSTGPHLHFGLKRGGRWVDPLAVIEGPGRLLPPGRRAVFLRRARALRGELEAVDVGGPAPAQDPDSAGSEDASGADEAMD